jgi:DnaJ family protein C protein 28
VELVGRTKDWENSVERQLREAQERGEFDDLPGRGRPLDLTPNPYAQDQELAFKILKDAGFAPAWIELDKVIRARLESARHQLVRAQTRREAALGELVGNPAASTTAGREQIKAGWQNAVAAFEEEIASINNEIVTLNLNVPSPQLQRRTIDVGREIARVEGSPE